jgi:predicted DCC family thiol-disulfide oxidoreductase YuxK
MNYIMPREAPATETIYYDGHCGLCHRWVRFLLAANYRLFTRPAAICPVMPAELRKRFDP